MADVAEGRTRGRMLVKYSRSAPNGSQTESPPALSKVAHPICPARLSNDRRDRVGENLPVASYQREVLGEGLGYQKPVERIGM